MKVVCAICERALPEEEKRVKSKWTKNYYCLPGEGCWQRENNSQEMTQALKEEVQTILSVENTQVITAPA